MGDPGKFGKGIPPVGGHKQRPLCGFPLIAVSAAATEFMPFRRGRRLHGHRQR
jgi:hypothetical protein